MASETVLHLTVRHRERLNLSVQVLRDRGYSWAYRYRPDISVAHVESGCHSLEWWFTISWM